MVSFILYSKHTHAHTDTTADATQVHNRVQQSSSVTEEGAVKRLKLFQVQHVNKISKK